MNIRFEDFKLRIFRAIFLTAVTFVTTSLYATDYYVKVTGSGSRNGDTWDDAMDNLSFAEKLFTAISGDVFHLAAGIYIPYLDVSGNKPSISRNRTFLIRDGVSIRGGYDASGNTVPGDNNAIAAVQLSGVEAPGMQENNACHVVTIASNANNASLPMLYCLTVTGGYANGGGNNSRGAGIFVSTGAGANKSIKFSHIRVLDNHSNSDGCGIYISNGADVFIDNSQITNNTRITLSDVWGGGISIMYARLNISNSILSGNSAGHGGAIHVTAGELFSSGCAYDNNYAGTHGGAVDMYERSKAVFDSDTIVHNRSNEGGGIHNESRSDITLKGCVLKQNTANEGAGFYNSGDCNTNIDSCTIEQNSAQRRGGGIDNRGTMTLAHSRITGNTANDGDANGGGVNQRGTLTVNQCEISYNTAQKGGGIYTENNIVRIANTTISNNIATVNGGGICQQYDRCELNFVTVTANVAPAGKGSGIMAHSRPTILNSIISGNSNGDNISGINLFETGKGSSMYNIIGSVYYSRGNLKGEDIAFDPKIHFGALAFNRGANTQTHALTWTGAPTNNPAIGKAVFNLNYENDQTGASRSKNYPSPGAYEESFFKAFDDIVLIGGYPAVANIEILKNDSYPKDCTPEVTLSTASSPMASQILYKDGELIYEPNPDVKGFDVVKYKIQCPDGYVDSANIVIEIGVHADRPQNIKDEVTCMTDMPVVKFDIRRKIFNDSIQLDGFSTPLVGDLNGDGKPEIVALGAVHNSGGDITWLEAVGTSIVIFDGQTGHILLNFNLAQLGENKFESDWGYGTKYGFQLRYDPRHNSYSHLALADLDSNGIGDIIVTETGSGKVYALTPVLNNLQIQTLSKLWEADVLHKFPYNPDKYDDSDVHTFGSPVPYVSDLNGDGIPEVIVYNKIYNGNSGVLELELETLNRFSDPGSSIDDYNNKCKNYAYVGRIAGAGSFDDCIPAFAINDIDDDGIMEIIAGSKIYKPKIVDVNIASNNSVSIYRGPESVMVGEKTYYLTDGFTVVADIDGDDTLDVIVVKRHENREHFLIYVWDPRFTGDNSLKAVLAVEQNASNGYFSVPFVGDINGRNDGWDGKGFYLKLPEICLTIGKLKNTSNYPVSKHILSMIPDYTSSQYAGDDGTGQIFYGHVAAFTYDARETDKSKRLKLSWLMKHSDISHQTGIVMFDFDADGINDLVYRDELSLRVISPAYRADNFDFIDLKMDHNSHPMVIRFRERGIASYTGYECPVIADVNGDGSADIITFAHNTSSRMTKSSGYLFVYEASNNSWASTRPVWNQGIYYPLQVNDNLTIPRRPQSTLTKYYSKLPHQPTGSVIRPFNGNWIQQPIVRVNNYAPILMTADPSIQMEDIRIISSSPSATKIRIKVENRGASSANSMTPVTFYHTSINSVNQILTTTLKFDIYPNEYATSEYILKGDYRGKIIYVRLVDNGSEHFPANGFIDCDLSNNEARTMMVTAVDDYFVIPTNKMTYLDVSKNDMYHENITPQIEIIESARNGFSIIVPGADSKIMYLPDQGFQGVDTIRYRIRCSDGNITVSDEAVAYILVFEPGSQEYFACPGAEILIKLNPVAGVEYNWYDSETGGAILTGGKNANQFHFIKGNGDEALWVQTSVRGFADESFPRLKINLPLPDNCNSDMPSACAINGTLLFREDFGGNSPNDVDIVPNGNLAQVKNYNYSTAYHDNSYTIRKVSGGLQKWFDNIGDHTSPDDNSQGYMLQFKATEKPGQFYECQLDDLCEGSVLHISAWLASISKTNMTNKAQLIFEIADLDGNTLSEFYTGGLIDGVPNWENYGFSFTVPYKASSIVMRIINNGNGSSGNSFVLDDIEIYLCVPEAGFTDDGNREICIDSTHNFRCSFTDDGSFGNDLKYRVEFRKDGGNSWQTVKTGTKNGTIDTTVSVIVTESGYYRLVAGNDEIIDCANCVAVSDEIYCKIKDCTPIIEIENIDGDTLVCLNREFKLRFSYSDTGSPYGSNVFYRWEFRHIDSDAWTVLDEKEATVPLNVEWTIAGFNESNEGFYRVRMGKRGSAGTPKCCSVSDSVRLIATDVVKVPDIRIQLSPLPSRTVNLSNFIDSIPRTKIRWERATMYSPVIIAGTETTTGSLNSEEFVNLNTYTYKYIATSQCGSSEAKVYIRTVKDKIFRISDTVMLCRNHESSKAVNLNAILGLELGGDWKYDATVNHDATVANNVTVAPSTSMYNGARVFDAVSAYKTAPALYSATYNGHNDAKIFKFMYISRTESSTITKKELVIVVTGT
jgi:hypothetical protein